MKMFQGLFGKDSGIVISAPINGKLVSIKDVKDQTFSEEILGKGVAIIPSDNGVYAPVDGTVTTMFPTGHAVALTTGEGAEVLIHVGLDTVKLDGKYFTIHAEIGQKVSKGELLLEVELAQIQAEGYDIITPIIICNSHEFTEIGVEGSKEVSVGDTIMTLKK